jgi:Bacterial transglutaminase-like N-terminal region
VVDAYLFWISRGGDRKLQLHGLEISLISLKIHHKTTYRFNKSVALGPHRLMLRPRENRDLHLISSQVTIAPEAVVTWAHDVFGNAVATATFQAMTDNLEIDSVSELQLDSVAWPVFSIAASAIVYPFRYSDDEWTDLGALTRQQYPDPTGRLRDWARAFVRGQSTDTLSLLKDLSAGVRQRNGGRSTRSCLRTNCLAAPMKSPKGSRSCRR